MTKSCLRDISLLIAYTVKAAFDLYTHSTFDPPQTQTHNRLHSIIIRFDGDMRQLTKIEMKAKH